MPETVSILVARVRAILSTKGSFIDFLCFFGMNFIELSLSLGILDMSRLIFDLSLLTAYTLNSFTHIFFVSLPIITSQHHKYPKVLPK